MQVFRPFILLFPENSGIFPARFLSFPALPRKTMNNFYRHLPRLLILAVTALILGTGQAEAKRVPKLYTFGPAHSEIGPIKMEVINAMPAAQRSQLEAMRVDTVGFHYKHFGLFWLDIWSWGGKYTVYNKLNEVPLEASPAQAAALLGIRESELKKPLSYHIPWGLVIIVGLILLKMLPRFLARRKAARESAQFNSPQSWSPPSSPAPPYPPHAPPAGGPPPVPPPLPPEQ